MSGSRKSLQRAAQTYNPRAENSWSKDDSKFGQKMLEKMGWKKGEGIGRHGQGMKESIKIRWKLDNKGLGFSIKEDEWVTVEQGFSELLSNLNKDSAGTKTTKLSLESTSSSSRSRVHYHKFIRGKDLSKYSKKDLAGILGRNEENTDNCDDSRVREYQNVKSCAEPIKFFSPGNQSDMGRGCEEKFEVDADSRCDAENANNFTNLPAEPETDCLPKPSKKRKSIDNHNQVESSNSKKKSKKKKNDELDPTLDLKESAISCKPEICKPFEKPESYLNLDDFGNFMEKVSEFNASTNAKDVIKEFEENKEALLKRYRQTYLRKYLEEANESDCRIYSDLNGDELDCEEEENLNEDTNEENSVRRKVRRTRPPRARHLSKAERIVLKARLLKAVQNKTCSHDFGGSNLNDIVGYGEIVPS